MPIALCSVCIASPAGALEQVTRHPQFRFTDHWIYFSLFVLMLLIITVRLFSTSRTLKKNEEQIHRQFLAISQLNETLERRIDERTTELQKSRDEWVRTFNALPDKIMILDTHFRIMQANLAADPQQSIIADSILSHCCHHDVHGLNEPPENCPHKALLADGEKHEEEIFDPLSNRFFLVTVTPFHEDGSRASLSFV